MSWEPPICRPVPRDWVRLEEGGHEVGGDVWQISH